MADETELTVLELCTGGGASKCCSCPEHEGPNPLPVTEFNNKRASKDGLDPWCRACKSRANRRWAEVNPEKNRASHTQAERRWREANPEKARAAYRRQDQADPQKKRGKDRRRRQDKGEALREKDRLRDQRARDAVFTHYGHVCGCPECGATERLSIDHVNGNGSAHRTELFGRSKDGGAKFYRWLIDQGFPAEFQVLCLPCNTSKGEGRTCRLDHTKEAAA